jgi:O-antigen ligase
MDTHRTTFRATGPRTVVAVAAAAILSVAVGTAVALLAGGNAARLTLLAIAGTPALLAACVRPDLLVYGGIALVSSDRFLSIGVSELTIKPSHMLFTAALAGTLLRPSARIRPSRDRSESWLRAARVPTLFAALGVLIATQLLSMYFSSLTDPSAIFARVMVMVGGAVIPLAAIILTLNTPARFRTAVTVFVLAEVIIACFGFYQLAAGYAGLPQGLSYPGTIAGSGRISALSAEAGHYAGYLVSALPLALYLVLSRRRVASVSPVLIGAILFSAVLLANARAGYLGALVGLALTLGVFALRGTVAPRRSIRLLLVVVSVAGAVLLVTDLSGAPTGDTITSRFSSSFSSTSDKSTIQRTDLYRAAGQILRDHPVLGVGDGNAQPILPSYGVYYFSGFREATILSIPLEVAAESGIIGLLALVGLYWQLGRFAFSRRLGVSGIEGDMVRALFLGAFVLLVINGLFIMWLWDLRVWAVVGLAVAGLLACRGSSHTDGGDVLTDQQAVVPRQQGQGAESRPARDPLIPS